MKKKLLFIILFCLILFNFSSFEKKVSVYNNKYLVGDMSISSNEYFLEKEYVRFVQPETNKNDFISKFKVNNATLNLECNNGTNYVGTSCLVNVTDLSKQVIPYSVVVVGDVNGDGRQTITDIVKVAIYSENKSGLSKNSYIMAADYNNDDMISFDDINSFAYYMVGNKKIPIVGDTTTGENIELFTKSLVLSKGSSEKIEFEIANNDVSVVEWKSSNEKVVTVDSTGLVTGIGAGEAVISLMTSDGNTTSMQVNVIVVVPATGVTLNSSSLELEEGKTKQLVATVSPSDATNKKITWSSSDNTVATVDKNGNINALKEGSVTITATTVTGKTASVVVNVVKPKVSVSGISLNDTEGMMYLNSNSKNVKLKANVLPSNATNKEVKWSSTKPDVATVNENGVVTIKNVGETDIVVVTLDGGYKDTYKLVVKKRVILVVTASLGVRMNDWFKSFESDNNNYYSFEDKTLKYVYKSGSGFDFQIGDGLNAAKAFLDDNYVSSKEYVDVSLFFTMTGNSVRKSTCDEINDSDEYLDIASNYNDAVNSVKNAGYNVDGFIISHSPLQSKHENASDHKIVYNSSSNVCSSGYRSIWKYYLSNQKMINILDKYSNLTFIDYFSNYLELVNASTKKFNWLRSYTTSDGLHWDETTTTDCMSIIFNNANM